MKQRLDEILKNVRTEDNKDRVCFNCYFGSFPNEGSACPIINSYVCTAKNEGVTRFQSGCYLHLYKGEVEKLTRLQIRILSRVGIRIE